MSILTVAASREHPDPRTSHHRSDTACFSLSKLSKKNSSFTVDVKLTKPGQFVTAYCGGELPDSFGALSSPFLAVDELAGVQETATYDPRLSDKHFPEIESDDVCGNLSFWELN